MINSTTQQSIFALLLISWLGIVSQGIMIESSQGWWHQSQSPCVYIEGQQYRRRTIKVKRRGQRKRKDWQLKKWYRQQTGVTFMIRLLLVWGCGAYSGQWGWYILMLALAISWWQKGEKVGRLTASIPKRDWLGHISQAIMIMAVSYWGYTIGSYLYTEWVDITIQRRHLGQGLAVGMGVNQIKNRVDLYTTKDEEGGILSYGAELEGKFTLEVGGDDFFRHRLLILFLRLLEEPDHTRGSRRTRTGRIPVVRQLPIADEYQIKQPVISRWEKYWDTADWRRLLSKRAHDVLTIELQQEIIDTFARFPWWGQREVYDYLQANGVVVSQRQVRQAMKESGWGYLRQQLRQRYQLKPEGLLPKDDILLQELITMNQQLVAKLKELDGLTSQELVTITQVQEVVTEIASPPAQTEPMGKQLEQLLYGQKEVVSTSETIRCTYCGQTNIAPKSKKARLKRFYTTQGDIQTVPVYRYYCHNEACSKESFTHFPEGLVPYSPYRAQIQLLAVQLVAWARVNYRHTATIIQVAPITIYRWCLACGNQLLPIATLFGVVRSTGILCIDEKYVLVPHNDKPQTKMKRWMYLFVAVDCYSYDLVHIALYQYRNDTSTRAFLLALKAKGYQPHTLVTDLWDGYPAPLADIFPQATHHLCIFHALQAIQRTLSRIFGSDYAKHHPLLIEFKQAAIAIFRANSLAKADSLFNQLLASEPIYLASYPNLASLFSLLRTHYPRLRSGITSKTIPKTNNAAELLIRRFDQHYQNFCGFHNFTSASHFIALFEKFYRFTPFSDSAQPHLRGRSPLEVAGYDTSHIPLAVLCRGWNYSHPLDLEDSFVPNL